MRNRLAIVFAIACVGSLLSAASSAWAVTDTPQTHTFQPSPRADLWDLDHYEYYKWGIHWSIPDGHKIVSANLFFKNIRNWDPNPNVLYVHLLDTTHNGVLRYWDNQGYGDPFVGQGTHLFTWHNLPTTPQNLTHHFSSEQLAALTTYAADGKFGLGLDPDCHFWNDGVTLTIITELVPTVVIIDTPAVPEPMTTAMLGLALPALMGTALRRRRIR